MPWRIVLYADYEDWPLWTDAGVLDEDALPLSEAAKHRIRAWLNAYPDWQRPDWPTWEPPSGVSADDAQIAWHAEGRAVAEMLQTELGPQYVVEYVE